MRVGLPIARVRSAPPPVSFRNRLTLFFVLIVLVPMISLAVVLFGLISDNEVGKADENLAARYEVATNLYRQATADAKNAVRDREDQYTRLAAAFRDGDVRAARARARALARRESIARIVLVREGEAVVEVGDSEAIAPAFFGLEEPDGTALDGELQVSVLRADPFSRRVRRLAGVEVVVRSRGRVLGTSPSLKGEVDDEPLPEVGDADDVEIDGVEYRTVSFDAPGFAGRRVQVSVLAPKQATTAAVEQARIVAAAILLGFFALAFAFALAVSRSLAQQVAGLLDAARRLGRGDFSTRVPTAGRDEFAALGEEFNKMSDQLEQRLAELGRERERVQSSVRRLGQAVGSNLDRDALLKIVLTSALEGVDARAGRVTIRPSRRAPIEEAVRVGSLRGLEGVVREAEAQVLGGSAIGEVTRDGASALAHPLKEGDEEHRRVNGVVSVARVGEPFSAADRELFQYLSSQASVSIENVDLHKTVAREAVTDPLTGLSNRRGFRERLALEVERSRRFGGQLGLAMGDIDDFKAVNDTHGHPLGDTVLCEVARIIRESSREIDEPARPGGEEFPVVLPGTDLEGAYRLAERMRKGIEDLAVDQPDGNGPVHVTASFGVASLPENSADLEGLVAAADAALYEAKRAGKNRTIRAKLGS